MVTCEILNEAAQVSEECQETSLALRIARASALTGPGSTSTVVSRHVVWLNTFRRYLSGERLLLVFVIM